MKEFEKNRREKSTEVGDYHGLRFQPHMSGVLFAISLIVFITTFDPEYALEEIVAIITSSLLIAAAIGAPRFIVFHRISTELLKKGEYIRTGRLSGSEQMKALAGSLLLLLMLLGPLILLFLLPSAIWFGSVLGIIIGYSASQLYFTLYVRRWESIHKVRLKSFRVTGYDESGRRVVLEHGVRSEKA